MRFAYDLLAKTSLATDKIVLDLSGVWQNICPPIGAWNNISIAASGWSSVTAPQGAWTTENIPQNPTRRCRDAS